MKSGFYISDLGNAIGCEAHAFNFLMSIDIQKDSLTAACLNALDLRQGTAGCEYSALGNGF